jgi:cobalamin biosynthesis protein CobT
MKTNRPLNRAFPIVAAALGDKLGVKVRVGGQDAKTDGDIIQVPAYDGADAGYRDVAWGFLAHEAAHVRYTQFEYFQQAATTPIRKAILNVLEDVRIEKRLAERYPGTRLTIEKTVQKLVVDGSYAAPQPEDHPAAVLQGFLLFRLRSRELGQTALSDFAKQAERILDDRFPAGAVTRLHGLLSEVPHLGETRDCLRLTDRILRMIQDEMDQARAQAQQLGDPDPDCPSEMNGGSKGEENHTPSDQDCVPERSCLQEDDEDVSQQSGDGGNRPDPVACAPGNVVDADETARIHQAVLCAREKDIQPDVFELAQDVLKLDAAIESAIILPTAHEPPRDDRWGADLFHKSINESGRIRATLQGLVQSSRLRKPVYKRAGNRLDGHRLFRIASGDARVFMRHARQIAPNTAVHLLVDRSPSMSAPVMHRGMVLGRRIDLAWEASIALALALEGISGVNPAVTAFPGQHGESDSVFRVLGHGARVRQRAGYFGCGTDGGTPLAEGLWYAASRLIGCQEPRKIILALTDGEPDDDAAARDILSRCGASGIEVVGIGLGIEVGHLFERSITIREMSELRSRLFELSRELLIAA